MRLEYHRTFSQFVDNYLASYYTVGGRTMRKLAGGPLLMLAGGFVIFGAASSSLWVGFVIVLYLTGAALVLYGLAYLLRPLVHLFLVWLRRDEFLGPEGEVVAIELKGDELVVTEPKGALEIPLNQITSVQHRTDSTWILTEPDNLIFVPAQGLLSGDHDAFVDALDAALEEEAEKR